MGRLDGKVALISGGARGQGAAEARLFAAEGAKVMVGDVLDDEGETLARELTSDRAAFRHHDVTDEGQWSAIVTEAVERFGQLDILVNNAGIFRILPMMQTSLDDYRQINDVNQIGVFLGMKAASPALVERGGGSIVNISSIAGLRGSPASFAYSASKWAVRGMTKSAALELAPFKVRVNSIHPGIIDTPMAQEFANSACSRHDPRAHPHGRARRSPRRWRASRSSSRRTTAPTARAPSSSSTGASRPASSAGLDEGRKVGEVPPPHPPEHPRPGHLTQPTAEPPGKSQGLVPREHRAAVGRLDEGEPAVAGDHPRVAHPDDSRPRPTR